MEQHIVDDYMLIESMNNERLNPISTLNTPQNINAYTQRVLMDICVHTRLLSIILFFFPSRYKHNRIWNEVNRATTTTKIRQQS